MRKEQERVIRAAMARWREYLAHYGGDERKAIDACYRPKGAALAKACAALAKKRK